MNYKNKVHYARFLGVFILVFTSSHIADAHQPVVVSTPSDTIEITDPNISFAYYGELTGSSQRFELSSLEPFTLYVQVLEPDIENADKNHSAIVYRQLEDGEEVVSELNAGVATWEPFFEVFGGDTYLEGAEYREEEASAGTYLIEVSSPENTGKYVLVTGTVEDFSGTSFLATVYEIFKVKLFFEKPPLSIFQTPFVYVPTILLLLIGTSLYFVVRRILRKRHKQSQVQ